MTTEPTEIDNLARFERANRIEAALRIARESGSGLRPLSYFPHRSDANIALAPRFPSGLARLDTLTGGGVYGVTTIAGAPKVGKSHLAVACAWEGARAGAVVVYLSADQAIDQTLRLLGRYVASRPLFPEECRERLHVLDIVVPLTSEALTRELVRCVGAQDRPVLLVVDSINSLAQLLGGDYFTRLHGILYFLVRARRLAQGDITVVAIAELNKGGDVKGRQAIYASDLIVRMQGAQGGAIDVDAQFSRESAGGSAGRYLLDHSSARLVPVAPEPLESWEKR